MREDSPDRYCKACGADWLGEPIPEEHIESYAHKRDDGEWSHTHFSRRIGLYSMEEDRTTAWQCPDCGNIVGREPKECS